METYRLEKDIKVFCVTAPSFPDKIVEAFKRLEDLHPSICERPFYGISFEDAKGGTIYKAAVEEIYNGEGEKYGCETFVISKGEYLSETIQHFMDRLDSIPNAFSRLLANPLLDKRFPCIEWYKTSDVVVCMVKLKGAKTIQIHNKN